MPIGWGHCDPAGIVYFPRFFELFHQSMESWFAEGLGLSYEQVIVGRKIGFPSVHTEADFRRPTRFGEVVVVELRVGMVGRTSIELRYRIVADADPADLRVEGRTVCVVMDLDPQSETFRTALAIPDDLRQRIAAFCAQ